MPAADAPIKTLAISPATHALLMRRKLDLGLRNMDEVLRELLRKPPLRMRVEKAAKRIAAIAGRHNVRRIRMFGSAARGEDQLDSDLDLIVDFLAKADLFQLEEFQAEMGRALACTVDAITEASLHPRLRESILAEAVEIYAAGRPLAR